MRALVCGAGHMGSFHAKVLRDLGYQVSTVDPDPSKRADYTDAWDAAQDHWDVAAIATPIEHLADTARALGFVPMLVEKPFGQSEIAARELASALWIHDTASAKRRKVCVGLVERFNPSVRNLRRVLHGRKVLTAHFTRWSDRASPDIGLDLRIHDIDLATHLGVLDVATFDTRAEMPEKRRLIEVTTTTGKFTADLMAHDTSPLHALWHTFLMGGDVPTPVDAIAALRHLQTMEGE